MTSDSCVLPQPWVLNNHSSLWHWITGSCSLIMITLFQIFRLKVLLHEFSMLGNQTEVFGAFQAVAEDFRDELCWSNIFTDFLLLHDHAPKPQGLVCLLLPTCKLGRCPDMKICHFTPQNKAERLGNIFFLAFRVFLLCVCLFFSFGLHASDMLEHCLSGDFV